MGKKDKRVDAYIAKSADFAKPILTHLRGLVHQAVPDVEETIKWSMPHFDYNGIMCSMASFKQHCSFGFWKAALLSDAKKLQQVGETAMGHLGRIESIKDLPADKVLLSYIKEAAKLNKDGVKVDRPKPAPKKPIAAPDYFLAALKKNKKAMETYEAFSPSHKREYLEWITEAKSEETRERRLEQALEWLAEGKSRHWKYVRK